MWGAWSDRGEPRQLLILSVSICALLFQFYFVDRTYSHFALLLVRTLTLLPPHPRAQAPQMLGGTAVESWGMQARNLGDF